MMSSATKRPITVALVDDYDVVVKGVANMFDNYRDRIVVAELDATMGVKYPVDIALYDSFAQPETDDHEITTLITNPRAHRVVVYTWNFHPDLIASARQHGAHGYLSKTLPARELVAALEAVHAGDHGDQRTRPTSTQRPRPGLAWAHRRTQRPRIRSLSPDHPRQKQRRRRSTDLPEPQHREVLHPQHLPQNQRR